MNTVETKPINMMDCTEAFAVPGTTNMIDVIHPKTGLSWIYGHNLAEMQARYPKAIRVNIEEFFADVAKRMNTPIEWTETTEKEYWEMLEVLPPAAMMLGCFLVGEPCDHHSGNGQPRFQGYLKRGEKYFSGNRPMTRAEFKSEVESRCL